MNATLSNNPKKEYDISKMDQYLNFFKEKKYNLNFAYFKFDFPFETNEYSEWSILKPINSNYYNKRCEWKVNKNSEVCSDKDLYVRHMSNLNLNSKLCSEYFCNSNENKCSKHKGKGIYSISGLYFASNLMKKF